MDSTFRQQGRFLLALKNICTVLCKCVVGDVRNPNYLYLTRGSTNSLLIHRSCKSKTPRLGRAFGSNCLSSETVLEYVLQEILHTNTPFISWEEEGREKKKDKNQKPDPQVTEKSEVLPQFTVSWI